MMRSSPLVAVLRTLAILATALLPAAAPPVLAGGRDDAPAADTVIRACVQQPSGIVRIVAQAANCHRSEVYLEWPAVGPPADGGPALSVVDSAGALVGPVVSLDNNLNPLAALSFGESRYTLLLLQGKLQSSHVPLYDVAGCAGPVLIERRTSTIVASTVAPDNKVYVDGGQPLVPTRIMSFFADTCRATNFTTQVSPAVEALDLGQFSPPFLLK
jgi:hypothetical protein